MSMKFWELYVRRVHDLKPVLREELHEVLDPDELIYEVGSGLNNVISVTDVGIAVTPHTHESPKYERYYRNGRNAS